MISGADDIARLGLPAQVEVLKLPGLRKLGNNDYSSRRLHIPAREIRALRAALLLTAVKSFRPTVMLVDKHPFGASGELKDALKALKKCGGSAALGFRDILDEPAQVIEEWRPYRMQRQIARHYDRVFIYGERAVFDPVTAYEFPKEMASRTRFCGYVVNRESEDALVDFKLLFPSREERSLPVVLASTGGGEDGFHLLTTFIEAAKSAPWQGVVIAGPLTPDSEWNSLKELAAASGVAIRQFVPQLPALFNAVDAIVCMGGYNTLAEVVSKGVPTLCMPRVVPRTEQLIRAEAFAKLGLLRVVKPDHITAKILGAEISQLLQSPKPITPSTLSFEGANQTALHLLALAKETEAKRSQVEIPAGVTS
ncbi:MAG: glycosyltransferase [Verrucomicrobiota bacterium]